MGWSNERCSGPKFRSLSTSTNRRVCSNEWLKISSSRKRVSSLSRPSRPIEADNLSSKNKVDAAAADGDSSKRIAYVAAFAMSNYSSTIGRIAKPFNPLLSETFEYVDTKKKYRYIAEQVCHHPPYVPTFHILAEEPGFDFLPLFLSIPFPSFRSLFPCFLFPSPFPLFHSISACIAQSPSWEYFGSVDAKSKFMGKSFEIRPTWVLNS